MGYPIYVPNIGHKLAEAIDDEVRRAGDKFGNEQPPEVLLLALMEEVGELSQAYLQDRSAEEIHKEAVQVAATVIRFLRTDGAPIAKEWLG